MLAVVDESRPMLFNAARASVGRLGVVVDVTLRIVVGPSHMIPCNSRNEDAQCV